MTESCLQIGCRPHQTLMTFLLELEKQSKFTWKHRHPQTAQSSLEREKGKARGSKTPDFKLNYRAKATKLHELV